MWRHVNVVFIPKPGKDTYVEAKSFRPISLTSFLLKALERLLDRYIRDTTLISYPLHWNQHAYQAGRSTETALHAVAGKVEQALSKKQFALAAFYDIEGAFDNAPIEAMTAALEQRKVSRTVIRWTSTMLKQRTVQAKCKDASAAVRATRGCPQGGVISPLLWSLIIDSLIRRLNNTRLYDTTMYTVGYADDGVTIISGRDIENVCLDMQEAMDIVEEWCGVNGLSVNPTKTKLMLFTRRRKVENFRAVSIYRKTLLPVRQVKFLGVVFDQKLLWKEHLEDKCKKATIALWQCRRALSQTWGVSPKIAHWLYTAVVRPILVYGAIVWWPRVNVGYVRVQLGRVQRLACLNITGAMRTTPTAAMEILLELPPLQHFVLGEALASFLRIRRSGNWFGASDIGHMGIRSLMESDMPILSAPTDHITARYYFRRDFEIVQTSREDWASGTCQLIYPRTTVCYTDGSRKKLLRLRQQQRSLEIAKAGAGISVPELGVNIALPLGMMTTVFQAELYAILKCAELDAVRNNGMSRIAICTDSKAALSALGSARVRSKLVAECVDALNSLARTKVVQLMWVPGHTGISGNEAADALAQAGARMQVVGPEPILGLSSKVSVGVINARTEKSHMETWHAIPGCRVSKALIEAQKIGRKNKVLKLSRLDLRTVVAVLTGHCRLNEHLNRLGITECATCNLCGQESESSVHYLCKCTAFIAERKAAFGKRKISKQFVRALSLNRIVSFIAETGRLTDS